MNLSDEMTRLVARAQEIIRALPSNHDDDGWSHHRICEQVANEFGLWVESENPNQTVTRQSRTAHFPIWLSRVVEGEMRDAE